jgi:hypothetical protein
MPAAHSRNDDGFNQNFPGRFGQQAGFSYLWLLLLVALMELGLVTAVEVESTIVRRDQEKALLAIGRQFQAAIGRYHEGMRVGGRNMYPATLEDLLLDPRFPGTHRHLRKIFVDPITGKAEWGLVKIGDRIVGIHSLSTQEPIKQGNFESDMLQFTGARKYSEWVFTYPPDLMIEAETSNQRPDATF